jgi:hypothetical protein
MLTAGLFSSLPNSIDVVIHEIPLGLAGWALPWNSMLGRA